jgi:phosphoribosylaminoimidazole-succinocarboxamide synthase
MDILIMFSLLRLRARGVDRAVGESLALLRPVLQNRSMQVRKLRILPIEAIVRGYITGSAWDILIMFSLLRLRARGVDRAVGESLALLQTGGDLDPESLRPVLQNRSMQVRKLRILPIEAIVRGYITG